MLEHGDNLTHSDIPVMLTSPKEEQCNLSVVAELLSCILQHTQLLHWWMIEMSPLPTMTLISHSGHTCACPQQREHGSDGSPGDSLTPNASMLSVIIP